MNRHLSRPVILPLLLFLSLFLAGCLSSPSRDSESTHTDARPTRPTQEIPPATAVAMPDILVEPAADSTSLDREDGPPGDLWERIRHGFRLSTVDNQRIRQQVEWLETHPKHLLWTSERALPYLHYIVQQTEQRGLPTELALLPVIESGFRPRIRSRHQAAGLWQFIPSTADAFGLKRTWWYDGRCDVQASTRAAFDYMQHLADQFQGDWLLALAAYNAGPSLVRRAIVRNRKEGLPTDYWSLDLPRETQEYLPRLLAVVKVVKQPTAYGIELTPIPNQAQFSALELHQQIDLHLAAGLAGMDEGELRRLNPGLLRWATDPDGPHRLLLPRHKVAGFAEKLAALPARQWTALKRYRIRPGDTLGSIAQRHGIRVADLKRTNKLSNSKIRAGAHLLIPMGGAEADSTTEPSSRTAQHSHRVQRGDTLWDIARSYRLNHRHLASWNGLSTEDTLRPGQILKLKGNSGSQATTYRVRNGDSLSIIARRHGVSVADLKRWNKLSDSHLRPGQNLTLYPKRPITTAL